MNLSLGPDINQRYRSIKREDKKSETWGMKAKIAAGLKRGEIRGIKKGNVEIMNIKRGNRKYYNNRSHERRGKLNNLDRSSSSSYRESKSLQISGRGSQQLLGEGIKGEKETGTIRNSKFNLGKVVGSAANTNAKTTPRGGSQLPTGNPLPNQNLTLFQEDFNMCIKPAFHYNFTPLPTATLNLPY